jgi:TonB family protein
MLLAVLIAMAQAAAPNATPAQSPANLASYISNDDYPADAMRRGAQGRVRFTLDVDATGAVGGCTITQSSNDASLDEATCRLLSERARFRPARDATGRAVPDHYSASILWRLETDYSPIPIGEFIAREILNVTRAGVATCTVTIIGTVIEEGTDSCGHFVGSGPAEALRRLHRDAQLVFHLEVLRPDMANSPPPAGRMIEEREARFGIDPEGHMVDCVRTVDRVSRPPAGLGRTFDLCDYRPPTAAGRFATLPGQTAPRPERIHSMLVLQDERPAPLR